MKTLKEISKTGIPDTKWCLEEDVKKMFDDYNKKLKDELFFKVPPKYIEVVNMQIDKLSKEVMGE